jgi:heat shock protein HslJ
MKSFGLVVLVSALVFAGCATRPAPRPADTAPGSLGAAPASREERIPVIRDLKGSAWVLVELRGAPAPVPPEGWSELGLEFGREGLRANGNAGVNRFVARYTQDGSKLVFGPLALTRRLGPAEWMEAEQRYTQMLSRVVGWRQEGAQLVLMTPRDTRAAVYERAPAPAGS